MSGSITAKEAGKTRENWARESVLVCIVVCKGNLWRAHRVGKIRNRHSDRWVLTAGLTTNMVSTHELGEIVLTEDEEIVGLRFRDAKSSVASEFEVNLFIAKSGGLDSEPPSLVQRMIQWRAPEKLIGSSELRG